MDDRVDKRSGKPLKQWLPFDDARRWARLQGLTSEAAWRRLRSRGLPDGVPSNPNRTYVDKWNGWRDFLGLDASKFSARTFRSLQDVQRWALSQGITSLREWRRACSEDRIPIDVPRSPWRTYPDWVSAPAFFGQDERRAKNRNWLPYDEARDWVQRFGLASKAEWEDAFRSGNVPPNIPSNPNVVYSGTGWEGWPRFFGRGGRGGSSLVEDVLAHELSHFTRVDSNVRSIRFGDGRSKRVDIVLPELGIVVEYDGAYWHRNSVRQDIRTNESLARVGWTVIRLRESPLEPIGELDVVVEAGWTLIRKASVLLRQMQVHGKLPDVSLSDIDRYESAGRLFSASTGLASVVGWRSFEDATAWARERGVTSETQWRELRRAGSLPRDIPSNPDLVYATTWISWGDFFGTGRVAVHSKDLVDYPTAKAWAQQSGIQQAREWTRANNAGRLPAGIPGTPSKVYRDEFEGWGIFLGISDSPKRRRAWRPFEETRQWARKLANDNGVDSETRWREFLKTSALPEDIPKAPDHVYRDQWVSWGDFFGTGNVVGGAARWRRAGAKIRE